MPYWWACGLWGERALALLGSRRDRGQRYTNRVNAVGAQVDLAHDRDGAFPAGSERDHLRHRLLAGVSLITFLALDLIGTMQPWTGMLVGLGYALGHHAVVAAQPVSRYGLAFFIAIVVLIIISQVRSARAARGDAAR